MSRLTLGITMGCPAGVGPEIIVKSHLLNIFPRDLSIVVLGDEAVLRRSIELLGVPISLIPWKSGDNHSEKGIYFKPVSVLSRDFEWGHPTNETAIAMVAYIQEGVHLHLDRQIDGLVTCPISKIALKKAGIEYPGHTEMLADLCNSVDYAMMMAGESLRVTLATIHVALKNVPNILTRECISRLITLTARALRDDFGIVSPRLAVAGLNPHSGEEGLFGSEEMSMIKPAMEAADSDWFSIEGPLPPDTVFLKTIRGHYDAVVCMYHDQGLIPFKLMHFQDGVNVTIGLPIVRTSVDHGTAYDIAGKGVADPTSLISAVHLAAKIARNRQLRKQTHGEY